jgi:oligoribonuclease NrnB/cAMP/cGMP phosphodiesterase (DHH superfamily)
MTLVEQYRKLLNRNGRILNVSHRDLDGVACSVVISNVFKNVEYISLKYGDVNNCLMNLDFSKYDAVIITDISPETEEVFNLSDKIFLLDHHSTSIHLHNEKANRLCIEGKCAASLCKDFFENLFKIDLSYLNEFIRIVNDYDLWQHTPLNESWSLNELYFKYYDCDFRKRFKSGDTKLKDFEIEYVNERKKLLTEVYNNLDIYELDSINACFFLETRFVNDLCHKLMEEKGYQLTICVNSKSKSCSVRNNMTNLHVGKMLENIIPGSGGHKNAGAFRLKDDRELSDKIDMIEKYLYYNCEDIKK